MLVHARSGLEEEIVQRGHLAKLAAQEFLNGRCPIRIGGFGLLQGIKSLSTRKNIVLGVRRLDTILYKLHLFIQLIVLVDRQA